MLQFWFDIGFTGRCAETTSESREDAAENDEKFTGQRSTASGPDTKPTGLRKSQKLLTNMAQ